MTVRAYFLLDDPFSGGEVVNEPALVPVLRTVPKSTATAKAAMTALLAGPSAKERAAMPQIETLIPAGSKLLGIEISKGLATVDLSAEFASLSSDDAWNGGVLSLRGRLAQVVYTLTQFPTVRKVRTTATFGFEAAGPKATRVTLLQTGWQAGEEWDAAYAYLAKGNAQLLTQLQRRFVSGPIDWSQYK